MFWRLPQFARKIPDVDTLIDGKMLSKAEKPLAKAAKRLGVRPLMKFFSTSADEAAGLLGEEVAGIDIPATHLLFIPLLIPWFLVLALVEF